MAWVRALGSLSSYTFTCTYTRSESEMGRWPNRNRRAKRETATWKGKLAKIGPAAFPFRAPRNHYDYEYDYD